MVACLRWLCELNILPCIPKQQLVFYRDLAQLALVPESHLCTVCCMLITTDFLEEVASTHVGHTALSYAFVNNLALSNGLVFLTETIVPASLKMAEAIKSLDKAQQSPYSNAFSISASFKDHALHHGRQSRQFDHFMRCITNDTGDEMLSALNQLSIDVIKESLVMSVSKTASNPLSLQTV
jgi:hypothetical protein